MKITFLSLKASILTILLILNPFFKNTYVIKSTAYTKFDCSKNLTTCDYATDTQLKWSGSMDDVYTNGTYQIPMEERGVVYNGLDAKVEELVAAILLLRVKKCFLSVTVLVKDVSSPHLYGIKFLPNTNIIHADNVYDGLYQVNYTQILYIHEVVFFLSDPSAITGNIYFPTTMKFHPQDKVWNKYNLDCFNAYTPSPKIISFEKSLLGSIDFNSLDLPTQFFLTFHHLNVFTYSEFPDLVGSLDCPRALLYTYNKQPLFIDTNDMNDMTTILQFSIKSCNPYISATKNNGCYTVYDYGVLSKRIKFGISRHLKKEIDAIWDATTMSQKYLEWDYFDKEKMRKKKEKEADAKRQKKLEKLEQQRKDREKIKGQKQLNSTIQFL